MPPNPVQNLLNALLDSNLSHPDRMIKFYKQDLDYFFSKDKSNTEYYISQLEKNIFYNQFVINYFIDEITDVIVNSDKKLSKSNIEETQLKIKKLALEDCKHTNNFFNDLPVSNKDIIGDDAKYLKSLKDAGMKEKSAFYKFIEEAEFQIIYYKALHTVIQYIFLLIEGNKEALEELSRELKSKEDVSNALIGIAKCIKDQLLLTNVETKQYFSTFQDIYLIDQNLTKHTNETVLLITNEKVIEFNYTLKDDEGNVIDQSPEGQPLAYLHGYQNIIPGLESQLAGKSVGDKFTASIEPADAYGEFDDAAVQEVPRENFQGVEDIQPGMQFQSQTEDGHVMLVTVKDVQEDKVIVDANHPLAGKKLHFDVEVTSIRDASDEELQHGHVHGAGGHHH